MFARLDGILERTREINSQLADPAIAKDHQQIMALSRELAQLRPLAETYQSYKDIRQEIHDLQALMEDDEFREMARAEADVLHERLSAHERRLKLLLLPKDPHEGRNVILEIRAGTGGDEAALFAGDLFRMYSHYCDGKGWKQEVFSANDFAVGGGGGKSAVGFKEILTRISGEKVYGHLRFESGVHRVQRVPLTEAQGRIHTSAATVAILPEAEPVEVDIHQADLRIDVFRAGGPGGQSVNTTDSAVRITHIPTGIVVICQDEKSQHKNKTRAMSVLASRLLQRQEAEQAAREAAARRAQVGKGDRSERIRTYNFPQNRITDHRINLTLYKLDRVLQGDLDELVTALQAHHRAELLKAQQES